MTEHDDSIVRPTVRAIVDDASTIPLADPADLRRRGDQRRRQRTLRVQVTALAAVAAAVVLAVLYLPGDPTGHPTGPSAGTSSTTTSSSPPPISTTTTTPPTSAGLTDAVLPLVVCPTNYGVTPSTTPQLPATMSVSVLPSQVHQLAVYSDQQGEMKIVAPVGWSCTAVIGADGSGGVSAYPPGQTVPSGHLAASSTEVGVVGSQSSACVGCTEGQACPLFASAAADYQANDQQTCTRPPGESVAPINADIVSFLDPPGVAGDGSPSGGVYPANGVMTYYPASSNNQNGSWVETCTLPPSETALCTTSLDRYVDWYGQK